MTWPLNTIQQIQMLIRRGACLPDLNCLYEAFVSYDMAIKYNPTFSVSITIKVFVYILKAKNICQKNNFTQFPKERLLKSFAILEIFVFFPSTQPQNLRPKT